MNRAALGLAIALSLAVIGCQQAPSPIQQTVSAVPAIRGQVQDDTYRASATIGNDIAKGATVSLIDTVTGQTKGTTVTDENGHFTLSSGIGFTPDPSRAYYMEAVKGLPVGRGPNRAGAPLARVRTLLFFRSGAWVCLTSLIPNIGVTLNTATTAVSAIVGLKALSVADQNNLVGKVTGSTLDTSGTVIGASEFTQVYDLVASAIANDQDPLEVISYDSALAQFTRKAGTLVLDDVAKAKITAGASVTFTGQNLPLFGSEGTVTLSGQPVATWSVNAARTQLTVTTTGSQYSGFLQITEDKGTWTGPFVPVQGTVGTLAGNGIQAFADGRGPGTLVGRPHDVTVDAAGNVYVADTYNQRLRKITPSGTITTLATGLPDVTGVAADASGNVYAVTRGSNMVWKVSSAGVATLLAGTGGNAWVDGATSSAQFNGPFGVAVDAANNVYVSEEYPGRVRKITPAGVVSTLAGTGVSGFADGAGTSAQFNYPCDLAVDTAGNVYVADLNNSRIRKIAPDGTVSTLASVGAPVGVAVDGTGTVFAGAGDSTLKRITSGGVVTALAGTGTAGLSDGPLLSARFNSQYGMAVGANGFIYVADYVNSAVRAVVP